jgi:hypothetical protein
LRPCALEKIDALDGLVYQYRNIIGAAMTP